MLDGHTVVVAGGSALLVGVLLFSDVIETTPQPDTLQLTPWWRLHEHGFTIHQAWVVALLLALCAGALFVFVPKRYVAVLPLLVFAYFALTQRPIENLKFQASQASR